MIKAYFTKTDIETDSLLYRNLYGRLPVFRKEKADRYIFDRDKILSVAAWNLLRYAYFAEGFDICGSEFSYGENGKPFINYNIPLYFNLSHSEKFVMCVISDREVGCDIQYNGAVGNRPETDEASIEKIAKRFFSKDEIKMIEAISSSEQRRAMCCRLWSLKESFLKASGCGLGGGLASFSLKFSSESSEWAVENFSVDKYDYKLWEVPVEALYNAGICQRVGGNSKKDLEVKKFFIDIEKLDF